MSADHLGPSLDKPDAPLESLIKYSGDAPLLTERFDLALFKSLNRSYEAKPVVPAPRPHSLEYGTDIGAKRAKMLDKKIGLRGLKVLEVGCGAGAMSRVLARDLACDVTGVDIGVYPEWEAPVTGDLSLQIHDITTQDNSALGEFDRVVSFAVFEHIVHPHAALQAIFAMLKPGGKAYIYANLYRGAKASHRYREVYFPWAHLLFEPAVWRDFYTGLQGEPLEPAWVNKLTYDQYVNYAKRAGFEILEHFPSAPFFDETFYQRFEQVLSAYPKFDLMHDFIHLVLQKPAAPAEDGRDGAATPADADAALLNFAPQRKETLKAYGKAFWAEAAAKAPDWLLYKEEWHASRQGGASAIGDQKPWVTFPAISYLEDRLKPEHNVFEWGSGGSTLFFTQRVSSLVSIEHEKAWHTAVEQALSASPNKKKVSNLLAEPETETPADWRYASGAPGFKDQSFENYVRQIEQHDDGAFDLVIVDGRARMGCLSAAISKVAPGGAVMLDNANYPRYRERLEVLRATELRAWKEVRLAGPGPYSKTPCWETLVWERPTGGEPAGRGAQGGSGQVVAESALPAAFRLPNISMQEISGIRQSLAAHPCRKYDLISYIPDETIKIALDSIAAGQHYQLFGIELDAAETAEWNRNHDARSGDLFIQSWDHLEPFFQKWTAGDDESLSDLLQKSVEGWKSAAASRRPDAMVEGALAGAAEDFSGYDTAVSNRFFRLAYFLNRAAPRSKVADSDFLSLLNTMLAHLNSLLDDRNIAWRHNHGLYQVLAQVCGASRFMTVRGSSAARSLALAMRHAFRVGVDRLDAILESQFTESGCQKEHSPFYHVAMANALGWVVRERIVEDRAVEASFRRIQKAAEHMFDHHGNLANFGDSDLGYSLREKSEMPVAEGMESTLYSDAGYWTVKGNARGRSTFLAQSCAFHSRFHKHADSGTLIWRERGLDILIDSGKYGYPGRTDPGTPLFLDGFWYSDPKRVHVESTRAHNTVEIDNQNHRRYRQAPLGGTITGEQVSNGVYASRCTVPNASRGQHQRFSLLLPDNWLLVVDTCRFPDGAHDMRQWFQLHPHWAQDAGSDSMQFVNGSQRLSLVPLLAGMKSDGIFCGARVDPVNPTDSGYRGWWSREASVFEPCTSLSFCSSGSFVNMATLISLAEVDPKSVTASVNATSRAFLFRWSDANARHEVKLTSTGLRQDEFAVSFKRVAKPEPQIV